jgi:hypothetical protein
MMRRIPNRVGWNAVFGEDVGNEELGELSRGDSVVCRNKDGLLVRRSTMTRMVSYPEDRELFDEIHGDRIPWLFWYQKLLQEAVWLVTLWFGAHTCGT